MILTVLLFGFGTAYGPLWGIVGSLLLAELVGWAIRFQYIGPLFEFITHGVVALGHTGERSSVALEKLKGVRERARDDLETSESPTSPEKAARSDAPIPLEQSGRKFDVGEDAARRPLEDLHEALGGKVG